MMDGMRANRYGVIYIDDQHKTKDGGKSLSSYNFRIHSEE